MKLDQEEAGMILEGGHEDYRDIIEWLDDQARWTTTFGRIIQDKKTGYFYEFYFERGSTEGQEGTGPFGHEDEVVFTRVTPVRGTAVSFKAIKER